MQSIVLIGNPNVGKSVLFYRLTGNYVTVANYPGTTVEITKGQANLGGRSFIVYDTPGMYSFSPITEEEAVTRRLLWELVPDLVVHVVDAKNLPRMLPLTLELISAGFQVILVLNMMDEAEKAGVKIDLTRLAERVGVPVVATAFTHGCGLTALKREIFKLLAAQKTRQKLFLREHPQVAKATSCLQAQYPFSRQMIARLYLEEDQEIIKLVHQKENKKAQECLAACLAQVKKQLDHELMLFRLRQAEIMLAGVFRSVRRSQANRLEDLMLQPLGGFLLVVVVAYVGLYLIVGRFGAGYLVDLLEGVLLGEIVLPAISFWFHKLIPPGVTLDLLVGDFGILTLGLRYALGVILPIVSTYFFVFAWLEDSGYLPRLAFWANGWMRPLGLNGRAVLPLTLGFGCGTMAVLVTRTLESTRERIIATFLLAVAVPCSAQLGLILALLSAEPALLLLWLILVGGIFFISGKILNSLLPGQQVPFFLELPPLRFPAFSAIMQKTWARMRWYFKEICPVFIGISVLLWFLQQTGLLQQISASLAPVMMFLGLPAQMGTVFLFGFLRRDYGAAGLWDLYQQGIVGGGQLLIAAVVLTLFLPCLAQLGIMIRERGLFFALLIAGSALLVAVTAGFLLRLLLA
ncbi:MAG: ferrous iron transport protein B [Firmicutes bacterium]|mgnify:CR=1 FL=1|nr:ferrous iron transport protein B [Bacillota bacterium]